MAFLKIKKWAIFYEENLHTKNIFCAKLSVFCFEISSFSSPGCCQFHIAFPAASMWHGSVLHYRCTSRLLGRQGFKLYIYIYRYIHIYIYTYIYIYIHNKIGVNLDQEFTFIGQQLLRIAEDWIV